jgi:Flp pilus assembly protein TadG
MTSRARKLLLDFVAKAAVASVRLRSEAKRLRSRKAGVAAVEFAFILPLLLALYLGVVVLAQGLEVGRRVQLLSHTLADLTTQTLPLSDTTGTCTAVANGGTAVDGVDMASVPCLTDADLTNIFNASAAVLYPFANNASMTITEVVFDNVSSTNSACCRARVVWSVAVSNDPSLPATPRSCGVLNQSANGVNGPSDLPVGFYPASSTGYGDEPTTGQPYVVSNNKLNNFVIIADVSYLYKPAFGFQPYQWNKPPNGGAGYTITQTTYMNPRFSASVTQKSIPAPSSPTATNPRYDQLIYWTSSGAIAKFNACKVGAGGNQYNLP